jgi:hypothetical protein
LHPFYSLSDAEKFQAALRDVIPAWTNLNPQSLLDELEKMLVPLEIVQRHRSAMTLWEDFNFSKEDDALAFHWFSIKRPLEEVYSDYKTYCNQENKPMLAIGDYRARIGELYNLRRLFRHLKNKQSDLHTKALQRILANAKWLHLYNPDYDAFTNPYYYERLPQLKDLVEIDIP